MTSIDWRTIFKTTLLLLGFISASTLGFTQDMKLLDNDQEMVRMAVQDYVLALYDAEPERIARSVDTSLYKIGYYDYDGEAYNHVPMTYQQLYELAAIWNKNGDQANADSPKKIEIYEVHDKTASAKLTAQWGIDFMHLSKVDGRWKIMTIMWQSDPK